MEKGGLESHGWSHWIPVDSLKKNDKNATGLYLLRNSKTDEILYFGEGKIFERVSNHLKKAKITNYPQRNAFGDVDNIECSFIIKSEFSKNQRLELENDLIASLIVFFGKVPLGQFIG